MKIEVLGPGCAKCEKLFENVEAAIKAARVSADLTKIKDIKEIAKFGVMVTPALVIDGVVKSSGRLLSVEEITKLIS